jgi:hypothetical protein
MAAPVVQSALAKLQPKSQINHARFPFAVSRAKAARLFRKKSKN